MLTRWTRSKLAAREIAVRDLREDFKTGINFLHLLEVVSGANLGKIEKTAKLRINMISNVNKVLEFLTSSGVKHMHCTAESTY